MSTPNLSLQFVRVLAGAACMAAAVGCGGEMLRSSRSPMLLVVESVSTTQGGATGGTSAFLLSDVQVIVDQTVGQNTVKVPTIFNDTGRATIRVEPKSQNPDQLVTPLNAVTLTRYHIEFRRADGRNTPGVDVPFGFDGGLADTIQPSTSVTVAFEIVPHRAKLEPPLKNLVGLGGQGFISTIAEITFYGHDQNGNEVSAVARINVQFGDFGDE